MRLLLVEDDPMIGESIEEGLRANGYTVDWVRDGLAAAAALHDASYDLMVLDLALPRRDGFSVLREYRQREGDMPVLIVSAMDTLGDRVYGLDSGADDYLLKPFDLDELLARTRALLRRARGRAAPELRHGALLVDPAAHTVRLDGVLVHLSAREFALLMVLLEQPGRVVSRRALEAKLYGWGEGVESNTVEVYVHALRRKLGSALIETVRGVGYRLA